MHRKLNLTIVKIVTTGSNVSSTRADSTVSLNVVRDFMSAFITTAVSESQSMFGSVPQPARGSGLPYCRVENDGGDTVGSATMIGHEA